MTLVHITDVNLSPKAWPVATALGARLTALCGVELDAAPASESGVDCADCRLLADVYDLEVRR